MAHTHPNEVVCVWVKGLVNVQMEAADKGDVDAARAAGLGRGVGLAERRWPTKRPGGAARAPRRVVVGGPGGGGGNCRSLVVAPHELAYQCQKETPDQGVADKQHRTAAQRRTEPSLVKGVAPITRSVDVLEPCTRTALSAGPGNPLALLQPVAQAVCGLWHFSPSRQAATHLSRASSRARRTSNVPTSRVVGLARGHFSPRRGRRAASV